MYCKQQVTMAAHVRVPDDALVVVGPTLEEAIAKGFLAYFRLHQDHAKVSALSAVLQCTEPVDLLAFIRNPYVCMDTRRKTFDAYKTFVEQGTQGAFTVRLVHDHPFADGAHGSVFLANLEDDMPFVQGDILVAEQMDGTYLVLVPTHPDLIVSDMYHGTDAMPTEDDAKKIRFTSSVVSKGNPSVIVHSRAPETTRSTLTWTSDVHRALAKDGDGLRYPLPEKVTTSAWFATKLKRFRLDSHQQWMYAIFVNHWLSVNPILDAAGSRVLLATYMPDSMHLQPCAFVDMDGTVTSWDKKRTQVIAGKMHQESKLKPGQWTFCFEPVHLFTLWMYAGEEVKSAFQTFLANSTLRNWELKQSQTFMAKWDRVFSTRSGPERSVPDSLPNQTVYLITNHSLANDLPLRLAFQHILNFWHDHPIVKEDDKFIIGVAVKSTDKDITLKKVIKVQAASWTVIERPSTMSASAKQLQTFGGELSLTDGAVQYVRDMAPDSVVSALDKLPNHEDESLVVPDHKVTGSEVAAGPRSGLFDVSDSDSDSDSDEEDSSSYDDKSSIPDTNLSTPTEMSDRSDDETESSNASDMSSDASDMSSDASDMSSDASDMSSKASDMSSVASDMSTNST
jgi:hypothetical protein